MTYSCPVLRPAAALAVLFLCSCGTRAPVALTAITPSWGEVGVPLDVVIDGSGFARRVQVDVDRPSRSQVDATFVLTLGDLPLESATYVDPVQLSARVPASLPVGVYTLTVTDPYGRTAQLPDAFTVVSPEQALVRIESAAGGRGAEVGDATVRVGQRLPLYAVARFPNGVFSSDVALASWALSGIGSLSATSGPAVAWSASAPGTAQVQVSAPSLGSDVTGTLTAVPCTQASDCADRCSSQTDCVAGACVSGPSTLDADGDGFIDGLCPGGNDCDDADPAVKPGAPEGPEGELTCTDNADNDCDGLLDLAEPLCVPNAAPLARLTLTPQVAVAGSSIVGSSAGTADRDEAAAALTYDWDWDGDGAYEAQGQSTSHSYAAEGRYPVVLRVTDSRGAMGFAMATAVVVASSAAIVTVTTVVDELNPGATPANPQGVGFSLREAVAFATATAGPQVIVVPAGMVIALGAQLDFTDTAGLTVAGNGAVLDGAGLTGAGSSCLDISGRNVRIDGLEIRNCPGWPVYAHGQDTVVTRCTVHHNRYGVEWAGSNDTFGPDNEVYANGTFGIDVNGTGLVTGNVFRNTLGPGILLRGGADNGSVVGNFAYDNERGIEVAAQADGVKLWHNTIHASTRDGVLISNAAGGVDARNNIVTQSAGFGLNAAATSFATLDANDLFDNALGACQACAGLGPRALSVAPGYLDAAARDLRTFRSSPVTNAGVDTGADRNGPAPGSFNGSAPDVGAFEAP